MDSNVGQRVVEKGGQHLFHPVQFKYQQDIIWSKVRIAILINAMNGDITIKAKNGNLRFEGDKINFVAKESFNVESHDKVDINFKC